MKDPAMFDICACGAKYVELRPWPPQITDLFERLGDLGQKFKDLHNKVNPILPKLCGACCLRRAFEK